MTPKQTIESIYEAFTRGDVAYIVGRVAPNAVWRQSKGTPWGGDYKGPDGAAEFFGKIDANAQTTGFSVTESVEAGNNVFSWGTYSCTMKATGKPASVEWMFRWVVENGKVAVYDAYVDSSPITAALG